MESQMNPDNLCTNCLLPRTVRGLTFDEKGICNVCSSQANVYSDNTDESQRKEELENIIETIRQRGKGKKYDCLVGLSGGKDSTYLLYLLVSRHKLRCQAAYYATPFTDKVIVNNIHRAVDRLKVPLVEMNISQKLHSNYAKKILSLYKHNPRPEFINLLCAPCKYVSREIFRIAHQNDISAILFGGNKAEVFQFGATAPKKLGKGQLYFTAQLLQVLKACARGLSLVIKNPGLNSCLPTAVKATLLYLNPHSAYLRLRYMNIMRMDYFFYETLNESAAIEAITTELGWELPPGCYSYWRADCSLAEVKNLLFKQTIGATYMDAYLSNMIRFGEISRDEALKRLESEGKVSKHRLEHVMRVMELREDYLMKQ